MTWLLSVSACTILRNGDVLGRLPAVPFVAISEMKLFMFQGIIDFFKNSFPVARQHVLFSHNFLFLLLFCSFFFPPLRCLIIFCNCT